MPGRGSYGPGGKWIYQRAKHLREKNPDMEESTSFAIATQQAHKVGKSPKGFRTAEGVRTAKRKFRLPIKEYRKTAGWEDPAFVGNTPEGMLRIARRSRDPGSLVDVSQSKVPGVRAALLKNPATPLMTRRRLEKTGAAMNEDMMRGFADEIEKIGGGMIWKLLSSDIAPGHGPLRKRLKLGLGNLRDIVRSQVGRHGLRGALSG